MLKWANVRSNKIINLINQWKINNHSLNWLFNQSFDYLINRSIIQSTNNSSKQASIKPTNQQINQSIDQSINQSINQRCLAQRLPIRMLSIEFEFWNNARATPSAFMDTPGRHIAGVTLRKCCKFTPEIMCVVLYRTNVLNTSVNAFTRLTLCLHL